MERVSLPVTACRSRRRDVLTHNYHWASNGKHPSPDLQKHGGIDEGLLSGITDHNSGVSWLILCGISHRVGWAEVEGSGSKTFGYDYSLGCRRSSVKPLMLSSPSLHRNCIIVPIGPTEKLRLRNDELSHQAAPLHAWEARRENLPSGTVLVLRQHSASHSVPT